MKKIPELEKKQNILGKLSSLFIDKYKVVYLLIISIIILGAVTYKNMPKESIPDVSIGAIVISTVYPGSSTEDVESLVTNPIESKIDGIDGVDTITSTTENSSSMIIVKFEDNYDMDKAETNINNKLNSISFPDGVTDPYVGVIETGELPIYKVTLTGNYDLVALKKFGEDLQSRIEGVAGVREVSLTGGYEREIQITVDFNKLSEYGLDINTLKGILQGSNINIPAGNSEIDGILTSIRVDESFKSISEIENILILKNNNGGVFLKDIAKIEDGFKSPDNYSQIFYRESGATNESNPAVYLEVFRTTGYDIIVPCALISEIIKNSPGDIFPSDITPIVTSDGSKDVTDDLSTVTNNALGGLITVIIVLFIFIGLNESIIVSSVIPISLLMTLILMNLTGLTLNSISLTGFIIALGLLVDNAIVVMENIDRLRDGGLDRVTASKVGFNQVGPAVLSATLTTIAAFLPVVFIPGIMGKFISVMPKTVIFIIGSSFLVSMIITPSLCSKFLPKFKSVKIESLKLSKKRILISAIFIFFLSLLAFANSWKIEIITVIIAIFFTGIFLLKEYYTKKVKESSSDGFIKKYKTFIINTLASRKRKVLILITSFLVFILSLATIPLGLLKLELFPYQAPSSIDITIEAPVGNLLDDTADITKKVESILYKYTDIASFNSKIGNESANKATINLDLIDEDLRELNGKDLMTSIRNDLSEIPGATFKVDSVTDMHKMGSSSVISIGLKGDNIDELSYYGNQYLEILKTVDNVVEPRLSTTGGLKELNVDINKNKIISYGLNLQTVAQEIRNQISGITVGTYKENGEEYDISIYYDSEKIKSINDFDKLFFKSQDGSLVNFNEIAKLVYQDGTGKIAHEDGKKILYIESDVRPGSNANIINKQFREKITSINLPSDIEFVEGGEARDISDQSSNMLFSFAMAILLVYIILVIQFNSLLQPVVILFSVPFAIIGVVFGLIVTRNNLGFYAMFGVVALVGIAVNDAIVLIDYINYLRSEGQETIEAIAEGVKTRFQPVIATSLTTIGGVLPLALYNDSFSQLGFALIFGLIASTVLTLLIIPIMYYLFEKITNKVFNLKKISLSGGN